MAGAEKTCFGCNRIVEISARFCSHCGRNMTSTKPKSSPKQPTRQSESESLRAYKQLREEIKRQAGNRNNIIFPIVLVMLIGNVAYHWGQWVEMMIYAVPAFVFSMLHGDENRWLTPREYYSLPGSSSGGEHRCIFCGSRGIYRKGEYKTDNTYARCPKCKEGLFLE